MFRSFVLVVLAGCIPGYHMPHGGVCPTDRGCEAAIEPGPKFVPPDDDHPPVEETVASVVAGKPASCDQVAQTRVGFELGNYAADEDRGPAIERFTTACAREHLDKKELECLVESADLPGMAYCVPHMFPTIRFEIFARTGCAALTDQLRTQLTQFRFSAAVVQLLDRRLDAVKQSCEHDNWPLALARCAQSSGWQIRGAATEPLEPCLPLVNPVLRRKIVARLDAIKPAS